MMQCRRGVNLQRDKLRRLSCNLTPNHHGHITEEMKMSRSGYCDDIDDTWALIRWRGAVKSATRGRRGQAFFKDLLAALDAMPVKRLIVNELEANGEFCTLGVLGNARGLDMSEIEPEEPDQVSKGFNIAEALAQEVVYMNDEYNILPNEEPEDRWRRMRKWVNCQIASPR